VDNDSSDGWKWEFDVPDGEGQYQLRTIAVDNADNVENKTGKDIELGYDVTKPTSTANDPTQNWYKQTVQITATATDTMSGIKQVELFYRYSNDGSTWSPWKSYGTDTTPPYTWDFLPGEGDGYYQLYTIATDNADNTEEAPSTYQADFGIDREKPIVEIKKPEEGYIYMFDHKIIRSLLGTTRIFGKITIQIEATDATSGVKEVKILIDDEEKTTLTSEPYEWTWNEKTTGKHTIKIVVTDEAGNEKPVSITVRIFNPFGKKGSTESEEQTSYSDNGCSASIVRVESKKITCKKVAVASIKRLS